MTSWLVAMILPFALLTLSPTAVLAQQIRQRETTSFDAASR